MTRLDKEKILEEIRQKGVQVNSIDDLIRIDGKYKDLIPIILKHLTIITDEGDKTWLVRCLGVKGFNEATDVLINEFNKASNDTSLKWTIGNTLSIIQDKSKFEAFLKIVTEKKHGTSRQMIVIALGKMRDTRAIPILLELLNDDDVTGHVIIALSNFSDKDIIPSLEPYTFSKNSWVRNEAKKAIKKISDRQ